LEKIHFILGNQILSVPILDPYLGDTHAHAWHVTHFPHPVPQAPFSHFPTDVVHLHSQRFFDMLTVDFSDNLTGFDVKSVSKITLECQLTTLKEFSELTSVVIVIVAVSGHGVQQIVAAPTSCLYLNNQP